MITLVVASVLLVGSLLAMPNIGALNRRTPGGKRRVVSAAPAPYPQSGPGGGRVARARRGRSRRHRAGRPVSEQASALCVVVCAYTDERWDDLVLCINSLLTQQDPVGEILMVIDHNDALLARCRAQWPQLTVIPNAGPKGLSGARNTGWRRCRGPLIAFVDDDASADPAWSREMARAYGDDVLGVGGRIDPVWPDGGQPSWWPSAFNWVVGCSYTGMPRRRSRVRNAIGANMSVRKHVLERVEGFETSLGRVGKVPLGAEETAMYLKAGTLYEDMSVLYEPAARVSHRVTPERVTVGYFVKRCFGEGRSKARMTRLNLAPQSEALGTERTYVVRTLPLAVLRGLLSADPRRGLAVLLGLFCTAAGYLEDVITNLASL